VPRSGPRVTDVARTPPTPKHVAAFRERVRGADTPEARLAVAYDYLRSRISKVADTAAANQIRNDVADHLTEIAEGLR
jgi:hypothetical protein